MEQTQRTDGLKDVETTGVLEAWIDGTVENALAVVTSSVEILEEARQQTTQRVAQTLDWAEGFPRGLFSFARKVNGGADRIAAESIRTGDRVARSFLAAVRRAGIGARGFASDTARSLVGGDGQQRAASRVTISSPS